MRPLGEREAVEAETRLLHALFDRLPAMVAYWDHECRNVIANEAYEEWFGFKPEDMRGRHIREVLGEDVYAKNLPFIEGVLQGQEQLFDRTLVDTSGRTRHTQASYVPDLVDGEVRGFFVLVTDVTPRVEAQRGMDESQSLAGLGSWSLVLETGEITWSEQLYRIFGVDRATFVPQMDSLVAMIHPDDVEASTAVRDAAIAAGAEYNNDYRICRPDGTIREVHGRGRPVIDAVGTVVRMTGTLQDVTGIKQTAREMARVNAQLRQVNQLNADVIGMLGHDVRGPLTVVLGYLEDLDEEWEASTETVRRAQVGTVRAAANRLRTLVDDILALASVDSGAIEPRSASHDLALLVADALRDVPDHAGVTVDGDRSLRAWCDAFHVRQIVANLVSNAVRYGASPVVVSLLSGDSGTVHVRVDDSGPGVPEDFVPRLFDRFARGEDHRSSGGTGLGLYIARRLAAANNGSLRYLARPGAGATFVLELPRA
jgi:PAS domain S-box-containing protein